MKNILSKRAINNQGREIFGSKISRFTIISPITNCFNIVNSKNKSLKVAFTLAEVLITIAIIGIVACQIL